MDYFLARYYSSAQGRFTSADQPFAGQHTGDSQSWNLFAYSRNNPLLFVDPTGNDYVVWGANGRFVTHVVDPADLFKQYVYVGQQNNGAILLFKDKEGNEFTATFLDTGTPVPVSVSAGPEDEHIEELPGLQQQSSGRGAGPAVAAGTVAVMDGPQPGPADVVAVGLLGLAVITALGPPPPPNVLLSQNKHNKEVLAGLLAAAETELGKLRSDPPGPGGPGNHHKGEIKAMLERAKRIAQRLVGKSKEAAEKAIEQIESEAARH